MSMSSTVENDTEESDRKSKIIYKYLPPPYHYGHPEGQPTTPKKLYKEKILERAAENPLIPIGMLATSAALANGIRMMYKGDSHGSQMMMRYRVSGQGFTIFVFVVGVIGGLSFLGSGKLVKDRYKPSEPPI